jgi:hypothetical protein
MAAELLLFLLLLLLLLLTAIELSLGGSTDKTSKKTYENINETIQKTHKYYNVSTVKHNTCIFLLLNYFTKATYFKLTEGPSSDWYSNETYCFCKIV